MRTEYDEVTHSFRMHMEKDQENMEMELEEKTATYFLNSLKFNYNYQVLEKKNTENVNQMVYEEKKKNWLKLVNTANDLKRQIRELKTVFATKTYDITKHSEKIRDRISKLEVKAKNAAADNESKVSSGTVHENSLIQMFRWFSSNNLILLKFQNILKMNIEEGNNLLSQICGFNAIFFEEHLGIRWEQPDLECLVNSNLATLKVSKKPQSMRSRIHNVKNQNIGDVNGLENRKLLQLVFEAMSSSMGYLMDKELPEILELCKMTDDEKKLAQIANIFSVSRNNNIPTQVWTVKMKNIS